ncbi:MAG: YdiU family protein, partial [Alphaproteobacteria bacterium]|nr:YdiU family protein [Alphaproteobacteria bacterium]
GESFDYGPWRFAPAWDPQFTAAYFDHYGLYSFGRQAEALHWNVHQLALSLRTIAESESIVPAFKSFPERYEAALRTAILRRLGVTPRDEAADLALIGALETALAATRLPPDRFFFDWRGGARRGASPADATYAEAAFAPFVEQIAAYAPSAPLDHPYWADAEPCSMLIDEVEAIWDAIATRDDWAPFEAKIAAIRRMGEALNSA